MIEINVKIGIKTAVKLLRKSIGKEIVRAMCDSFESGAAVEKTLNKIISKQPTSEGDTEKHILEAEDKMKFSMIGHNFFDETALLHFLYDTAKHSVSDIALVLDVHPRDVLVALSESGKVSDAIKSAIRKHFTIQAMWFNRPDDSKIIKGVQFSVDGKSDWHTPSTPEDYYVRFRTESGWSEPCSFGDDGHGSDPEDWNGPGDDGTIKEILEKRDESGNIVESSLLKKNPETGEKTAVPKTQEELLSDARELLGKTRPAGPGGLIVFLQESGWGDNLIAQMLGVDFALIEKVNSGHMPMGVESAFKRYFGTDDNRLKLIREADEVLGHKLLSGPDVLIVTLQDKGWSVDKISTMLGVKDVTKEQSRRVMEEAFENYRSLLMLMRQKASKTQKPTLVPCFPKKQSKAGIRNRKKKNGNDTPLKPVKAEEIRAAINPAEYKDIPSLITGIQEKTGLAKKAIAEAIGLAPSDLSCMISGRHFYPYMQDALRRIGWPAQEPGEEYKSETHARQALEKGEGK